MTLRADIIYQGKVGEGSYPCQSQKKGTSGYVVMLECDDGNTEFTIWLTPKNKENAKMYFEILGVDFEKMKSATYIAMQLAHDIAGKDIAFQTKSETWNDKTRVKVDRLMLPSQGDPAKDVAAFFGGEDDITF